MISLRKLKDLSCHTPVWTQRKATALVVQVSISLEIGIKSPENLLVKTPLRIRRLHFKWGVCNSAPHKVGLLMNWRKVRILKTRVEHLRWKSLMPGGDCMSHLIMQEEIWPYTKPIICSWGINNGYQRSTWGDVHSDPKPSLGSTQNDKYDIMLPKSTENDLSSPANGRWRASKLDGAKEFATSIDTDQNHQGSKISV